MTFANSLDQDQDRHFVGPDIDPNRLTIRALIVFLNDFFIKVNFENTDVNKSMQNYQACKLGKSNVSFLYTPNVDPSLIWLGFV